MGGLQYEQEWKQGLRPCPKNWGGVSFEKFATMAYCAGMRPGQVGKITGEHEQWYQQMAMSIPNMAAHSATMHANIQEQQLYLPAKLEVLRYACHETMPMPVQNNSSGLQSAPEAPQYAPQEPSSFDENYSGLIDPRLL
jgi:hypothetical protein